MSVRDTLLTLFTVLLWGFNFVVIKWGIGDMSAAAMTALRFSLVAFPLVFLSKNPARHLSSSQPMASFLDAAFGGLSITPSQSDYLPVNPHYYCNPVHLLVPSRVFCSLEKNYRAKKDWALV